MATAGRAFKEARIAPLPFTQYSHFTPDDVLDLANDTTAGPSVVA